MLTQKDVIRLLRREVQRQGSQLALAHHMGASPAYVSDVLRGDRKPGKLVLRYLGLERKVGYLGKQKANVKEAP